MGRWVGRCTHTLALHGGVLHHNTARPALLEPPPPLQFTHTPHPHPRNQPQTEWISSYHTLGADIAAYNNPDWASGGAAEAAGNVKSAERGKRKGAWVCGWWVVYGRQCMEPLMSVCECHVLLASFTMRLLLDDPVLIATLHYAHACNRCCAVHHAGSPVVPGSTQKLFEDSEACLYTVTILKVQRFSSLIVWEQEDVVDWSAVY